jgi:hypothetical protein
VDDGGACGEGGDGGGDLGGVRPELGLVEEFGVAMRDADAGVKVRKVTKLKRRDNGVTALKRFENLNDVGVRR